ncbi:MAG TPA: DGQHR domain-containing protein [Lacunisphaera sp.]|nr:DGQHR domain-containing protein [Lacunisphaera sp.]
MKTVTLPAIEVRQNGARLLLTRMRAGDLDTYTEIEVFDPKKDFDDPDQGYQREPDEARVKKFAKWLISELDPESGEGHVRMPTAILLSSRGADVTLSTSGTITLRENAKLPLIDGQHRKRGFEYAINEKGITELADYDVPVVIMLDLDKVGEMRQFSTVNGTAKQVRTDLVNMILTQLVSKRGDDAVREKEHWKVVVSRAVTVLNEDKKGPWFDRIVMPNSSNYSTEEIAEDETLRHRRIVRATSFMQALKPIEAYLAEFDASPSDSLEERANRLATVVNEFWKAVRAKMPECFKEADNYVIQKTPGVFSLHMLCRELLKGMYQGRRPWTQEHFEAMIADISTLSRPDFWHKGDDDKGIGAGEASKYGSMKGFKELFELIEDSR